MSAAIGYCGGCRFLFAELVEYKIYQRKINLCHSCEVHLSWPDVIEIVYGREE